MEIVLVTAIGSFAADITIKNLQKAGYKVIGCDIYPKEWIVDAYSVDVFYQAPYVTNEIAYTEFIHMICKKEKITYILPLTDIEVDYFNMNRDYFEKNNIVVCISSAQTLNFCRNKNTFEQFINENVKEVNTIPTSYIKDIDNLPYEFPVVCKPFDGRSSQGLKYIYNPQEWNNFINNTDTSKYIVQPYIKGSVITVDIVRQKDGKTIVAIPREELLRTINGAGTSVRVFVEPYLVDLCKKVADSLNIYGCVNVEFIKNENGIYYIMECNPRFSGGVEFSCLVGYDCILNHMEAFKNNKICDFVLSNDYYIARKYEEYITKID